MAQILGPNFLSDGGTITIYKPLAVTLGPQGLGMIPWMFLGDRDKYVLQRSHVFAVVPSRVFSAKVLFLERENSRRKQEILQLTAKIK